MSVTCLDVGSEYVFIATEGDKEFEYRFPKDINGKTLDLQKYKAETIMLANLEVQKQQAPRSVTI